MKKSTEGKKERNCREIKKRGKKDEESEAVKRKNKR